MNGGGVGDESLYTMREAKRQLALEECAFHGHDWRVILARFVPTAIICERCGRSHEVVS